MITKSLRVAFLINEESEKQHLERLVADYIDPNIVVEYLFSVPALKDEYKIIIPWNYRKIIKDIERNNNIVVFHSTDLPKGRGCAPIYNTVVNREEFYCISACLIDSGIDTGNILAKLKFKMQINYTAEILRVWDDIFCFILINEILKMKSPFSGKPQKGEATYYAKRKKESNEVDVNTTIVDILDHLRASEYDRHPAYFIVDGIRFNIKIVPDEQPLLPTEYTIDLY